MQLVVRLNHVLMCRRWHTSGGVGFKIECQQPANGVLAILRSMSIKPRPFVRLALIGATFSLLAACGNKGPLVMPQKPVPVEAQPASQPPDASTPAPASVDSSKHATTTDQPASSGNER